MPTPDLSGYICYRLPHLMSRLYILPIVAAFQLSLSLFASAAIAAPADPSQHPLYSTYTFLRDGKHIYFSTQPSAAPEGVIGMVMSHDAILKRNLKKLGMEVIFYPFLSGPDSNDFMQKNQIDMTIAGDMPTLAIAASGKTMITGIAKLSNASIVTRNKFNHLRDLKGKRIGVPVGTTAHLGLLIALASADMTEADIQVVPLAIGDLTAALIEKRIDAFSAWEPIPTGALSREHDFVVIHRFLNSSYLYQTRQFSAEYPAASLQMHAAFLRALRWMNAGDQNLRQASTWALQEAEALLGYKTGLSPEQIAAVTSEGILRFADSPIIPRSDFKPQGFLYKAFVFLKERGKLPDNASWDKVVQQMDNRTLKTILAQPKEYELDTYLPDQD